MNRTRHATENDEDTLEGRDDKEKELTPPTSSPVSTRALPLQNLFGDAAFTFQGSFPPHFSPYFGVPIEPEVTYEVIENGREGGGGRKRAVSHQQGSIWDLPGNKKSRHV